MMAIPEAGIEWLEADGLGGFASGTATGVRTRRYHALLLTATTPPTGRIVLVNGFDAWVTTPAGRFAISSQRYQPDVVHPDGATRIMSFTTDPWPTWEFETPDGVRVSQEILVSPNGPVTLVLWRLVRGAAAVALEVRPFLSGRDYHALHHENGSFAFSADRQGETVSWHLYDGLPDVHAHTNGAYTHAPDWYRHFFYSTERERGLDDMEDLASPGVLTWTLTPASDEATCILRASGRHDSPLTALSAATAIVAEERARRGAYETGLDRAADAYLVRRGSGRSIVAGYPWFTDWGRDTFIAVRGLCIARGHLADARDVLLQWAGAASQGMLPNRFPDAGEAPEFNAVDASLWFIVAVHDLLERADSDGFVISSADRRHLLRAIDAIVTGYSQGTRFGIRADEDGLLAAGERGLQLTWMDARVGDREITPRIGKPVEVEALWINALWIAQAADARWRDRFELARRSFNDRFWNDTRSCLYDVIDVDHVRGAVDATLRPNQILAVGGLPLQVLEGDRALAVVSLVDRELLTPSGLRSLGRSEPGYAARYAGGPSARDAIYHQGIVWPWLLGSFVEAWVRVRGNTDAARDAARARFVEPMLDLVTRSGGHLCEITDAEPPFTARGCPFQAWSLGELIRADHLTTAQRREHAALEAGSMTRAESSPVAARRARPVLTNS